MGEKANEVTKKKMDILLRDVKSIDCAPTTNDERQQLSLGIDLTTNDRECSFLVKTVEEKTDFIRNLRKVRCKKESRKLFFKV